MEVLKPIKAEDISAFKKYEGKSISIQNMKEKSKKINGSKIIKENCQKSPTEDKIVNKHVNINKQVRKPVTTNLSAQKDEVI